MNRPTLQRGQALTEFLVVAVVLMPLFLLIPIIGKYQDLSHAAQVASRYVAFEAMTRNHTSVNGWKPEAELANDVRRRFFSNPGAPIRTQDGADDAYANQNLFWRDPQNNSLINAINNDVTVDFGPTHGATHGDGFSPYSGGILNSGRPDAVAAGAVSGQLALEDRGIYTASVNVRVANLPAGLRFYEPFDAINLSITRGTSVLVDSWAARSPQEIESKIAANAALFPVGTLAAVSPVVDAAIASIDLPGAITGPRLGRLDFWTDVVPQDRVRAR